MRALLLLSLSLCAACLRQTEFRCLTNDQCNPGGTCQTAAGYCSFADTGCMSGQRFGDSAGPLAGQCVGEQTGGPDGGVDGPPVDSPTVGACPADYAPLAGGPAGHVYKKAPGNLSWTQQFDFCRNGSMMRAYLAVPNDATELTGLHTLAGGTFWVGINDRVTEGAYVQVETNTAATFLPWANGQPDNAGGGQGEDCVAATATTISDEDCTGGNANRPAVCECNPP